MEVRWRDLFRYRTVRGMMLGFFCLNFVIYFFLTWFPTYLKEARGLDLTQLGGAAIVFAAPASSVYVALLLLDLNDGSYGPAFALAGAVAVVGALTYAFVVGRAEPLPALTPKKVRS